MWWSDDSGDGPFRLRIRAWLGSTRLPALKFRSLETESGRPCSVPCRQDSRGHISPPGREGPGHALEVGMWPRAGTTLRLPHAEKPHLHSS